MFGAVKRYFLSGVLIVVPIILTYLVLKFLFEGVDGILRPALQRAFGYYVPGLGFLTTILIIIIAGILTRNFFGARLYRLGDRILVRTPLIRTVYSAAKQLLEAFALPSASSFMAVALVEYPRRGAFSLGFISRRIDLNINGEIRKFATVFIPATPTPVTGSAVLVPVDELILVNMTVEEGIKFIVSGGVVSPESIKSVSADAGTKTGEVARETR